MQIFTILPVSRKKYLDRVLESLLNQTHKTQGLLVIFDGPDDEFLEVRNKIVSLDIDRTYCVSSNNIHPVSSIPDRRRHIVNIHNQIREMMPELPTWIEADHEPDWIFSIEDDGILPSNALERLVEIVKNKKDAGMVTGVELGRWGVPYVGAWNVDNVDDVKELTSLENKASENIVDEIDACGLYCGLIRADFYKQHEFFTNNGLGPDVNLGLFLRKQGLKNYIDWGVTVTHLTNKGNEEREIPATDVSRVVKLRFLSGRTWQASHQKSLT